MKTYRVRGGGGLGLHVQETGNPEGKPILFIHGFSQCRLAWNKQLHSDLAKDFRLVAMDLRGHGLSEKPPDVYGEPGLWAADVQSVITTLALDNPVIAAWSYGGIVVSDYVACYGEGNIAGTCFVGAVSRLGEPLLQEEQAKHAIQADRRSASTLTCRVHRPHQRIAFRCTHRLLVTQNRDPRHSFSLARFLELLPSHFM